jgi:Zn-dependent metalloprotease
VANVPALCSVIPEYLLAELATDGDREDREAALRSLVATAEFKGQRQVVNELLGGPALSSAQRASLVPDDVSNTVYDARNRSFLPGFEVRAEGDPPSDDDAVNEAFDGAATVLDFYRTVFDRNSLDGTGLGLVSSVHYLVDYDNAGWDGRQMSYGDGSGRLVVKGGFTHDIAVIGHEFTHGVVQFTAALPYHTQTGALNESMADVFGSLVKQHAAGQSADEADWLIGEGILGTRLHGVALRSLKAPGTAYDRDRQPAHMDDYVDLPDDGDPLNDHGGVHINSGIPNRAFFLAATELGGEAWKDAGAIWYRALTRLLDAGSEFKHAADATVTAAVQLFGKGTAQEKAVRAAWQQVGVL